MTPDDLIAIARVKFDPKRSWEGLQQDLKNLHLGNKRYYFPTNLKVEDPIEQELLGGILDYEGRIYRHEMVGMFNKFRNHNFKTDPLIAVWNMLSFWELDHHNMKELLSYLEEGKDVVKYLHHLRRDGIFIKKPPHYDKTEFMQLMVLESVRVRQLYCG